MKKLLATLLATTMAVSAFGGLVACGEKEPEKVAATGISLTDVYGAPVTALTIAPDSRLGVLAKLTPANANSEVTWSISGTQNISVNGGGLNNIQALLFCSDYTAGETVKLKATVDGKSVEIPVTINDWTRFMVVGGNNGWNQYDYSEQWLFTQQADKHVWKISIDIPNSDYGIKVIPAARVDKTDLVKFPDVYTDAYGNRHGYPAESDGKIAGLGWNGGYNLGIDKNNPDAWSAEEQAKPASDRRELKQQAINGTEGTLNIHNDGGSGDIKLGTGTAGKYELTLETNVGGSFKSLTYKRVGDVSAS